MIEQAQVYEPTANVFSFDLQGIRCDLQFTGSANVTVGFDALLFRNDAPIMYEAFRGPRQIGIHAGYAGLSLRHFSLHGLYLYPGHVDLVPEWREIIGQEWAPGNIINMPGELKSQIQEFIHNEFKRFVMGAVEAIEAGIGNLGKYDFLWRNAIEHEIGDLYIRYPYDSLEFSDLAKRFRQALDERAEREVEWDEIERAGKIVVMTKRCWECGRLFITGEKKRDGRVVRMSKEVWSAAQAEIGAGVRRASAGHENEIISSVGFVADPTSKFVFRVSGEDYHCGC
jgi:hypothetical protein